MKQIKSKYSIKVPFQGSYPFCSQHTLKQYHVQVQQNLPNDSVHQKMIRQLLNQSQNNPALLNITELENNNMDVKTIQIQVMEQSINSYLKNQPIGKLGLINQCIYATIKDTLYKLIKKGVKSYFSIKNIGVTYQDTHKLTTLPLSSDCKHSAQLKIFIDLSQSYLIDNFYSIGIELLKMETNLKPLKYFLQSFKSQSKCMKSISLNQPLETIQQQNKLRDAQQDEQQTNKKKTTINQWNFRNQTKNIQPEYTEKIQKIKDNFNNIKSKRSNSQINKNNLIFNNKSCQFENSHFDYEFSSSITKPTQLSFNKSQYQNKSLTRCYLSTSNFSSTNIKNTIDILVNRSHQSLQKFKSKCKLIKSYE